MKKVLLISVIVTILAVGLIYIEFTNSPIKKFSVRQGVVVGEMGFVEARQVPLTLICAVWAFVLIPAALISYLGKLASKGKTTQPAGQQAKPAGWYSDPQGHHKYRYWDGSIWTDQVSDQDQVTTETPD